MAIFALSTPGVYQPARTGPSRNIRTRTCGSSFPPPYLPSPTPAPHIARCHRFPRTTSYSVLPHSAPLFWRRRVKPDSFCGDGVGGFRQQGMAEEAWWQPPGVVGEPPLASRSIQETVLTGEGNPHEAPRFAPMHSTHPNVRFLPRSCHR